ncbi:hypothetical protein NST62_06395 [Ureibacillus sp. FSL K6-8385]|uniref:Uncharacterized protein n=1 Tax=Ureibacillus terrenus TaxID=118246 RepID=A0A540V2L3_9BACL|nr:hypothetical protein [Ureibacillus terrenus]MED3662962.1 hypothetical protein [Ureibacillus terrenus]MED3765088.1 hypothetical protein [Ureibacillus terrenus]TQE90463.1 hypothetical protein FKZ59_09305 [Ureibacillus terrenus]
MNMVETLVNQSRNVMDLVKQLRKVATKKGSKRTELIEKFTANQHSFNVYTYASEEARQSKEVDHLKVKLDEFSSQFDPARYEDDGEVNAEKINVLYREVLVAYNDMVVALGYDKHVIDVEKF